MMKITTRRLKQIIREELEGDREEPEGDPGEERPFGSRETDSTRMAADLPQYGDVRQEMLDLANKIETGEVADMDAFLSEFIAIQNILDAYKVAVSDDSGQVHERRSRRPRGQGK